VQTALGIGQSENYRIHRRALDAVISPLATQFGIDRR
jgi:hypothetical protein